jgi:hypothetical protein
MVHLTSTPLWRVVGFVVEAVHRSEKIKQYNRHNDSR